MIWLALACSLLMSFLLSGIESAVLTVSRVRARHAADEGDKRAARLLRLLEDRDALLGAVVVANHVFNLAAFSILAWQIVLALGPSGFTVAFLVALPVFLIGLEVLPKTLFRRYPFRILRVLLPVVSAIGLFRAPFKTIRRLQPDADADLDESATERRADLKTLCANLAAQKILRPAAASLIGRVLDFQRHRASALMVPLSKLTAVPPDIPVSQAVHLASENGFAALPVLGESGGFTGVLEIASLPSAIPQDRLVRQQMRPLDEVLATDSALRVLQRLRKRGRLIALVKEPETQRAAGIVTEEDLLKPLLGGPSGA